eukprot:scaffold81106_cov31-Tisochrysis_lutea.AAC.5
MCTAAPPPGPLSTKVVVEGANRTRRGLTDSADRPSRTAPQLPRCPRGRLEKRMSSRRSVVETEILSDSY